MRAETLINEVLRALCVPPRVPRGTCTCTATPLERQKRRANEAPWEARLRDAVRAQHPFGYSIREMKGKVSIQRYWLDTGKRESASLPLEWHPTSQRELLNALHGINAAIGRGLSLKEAVKLTFDVSAGPSVRTNWTEVLRRFRTHKLETGAVKEATWDKEYEPRLQWLVDNLTGPAGANNGEAALEAMRVGRNCLGGEPGSRGRKLRIYYAAQMLRFAVEHVGLDQRWLPPGEARMAQLIGKTQPTATKANNAGQAWALTDEQFLRLLDSISNPRWHLAIGLIGVFGLRGMELNYVSAGEDGPPLCSAGPIASRSFNAPGTGNGGAATRRRDAACIHLAIARSA